MRRSYAQGSTSVPLLGETIGERFDHAVARFGEREALVVPHQEIRWTYSHLGGEVDRLARALLASGIEVGDRVGIWAPNCVEWVLAQFATAKVGAILVNVNPAYRASELEYALGQSGTRMLISAVSFKNSDYAAMIEQVAPRLPSLERVVLLGSPSWSEMLAAGDAIAASGLHERMASLDFDDPINIQYTSGTTGFPKGATLSHHNILNNAFFVGQACNYTEVDRICVPVPFYHCFGMVMGSLSAVVHGAATIVPAPSFEPEAVLRAVAVERCTSLYGVPTMFIAELMHPAFAQYDLSSLRTGIMAGSPCPIEVMKRVVDEMHMEQVAICYGMTETSPVSTQTSADDTSERRVKTVGRVHPHVEIKLVDPLSGRTVPRGVPGELLTRGYSVMLGYWDDPKRTAEAIDEARWMHTGDLATMDEEGYLNIVGRSKEMVIRGGENVYPREIEEFLHSHPDIAEVAVIGVPDVKFGEEIMAWVRLRAGADCSEAQVREFCRGGIAHFKVPRYVRFADELPMTVTGKIQKFKLREAAIAELGLEHYIQATA